MKIFKYSSSEISKYLPIFITLFNILKLVNGGIGHFSENKCYREEIVKIKNSEFWGNSSRDIFSFIAVGDTGGLAMAPYTSHIGRAVSRDISNWSNIKNPNFALLLGDNFYERGVLSVTDPRFKKSFEDLYDSPALMIPWYVIGGNHDHMGNITAQYLYQHYSDRWRFPCPYYTQIYTISSDDRNASVVLSIQVVAIDTVILCDNFLPFLYHKESEKYLNFKSQNSHWVWLNDVLSQSKADYLFVIGHYPIYSIANHGPTPRLVQRLKPLLHRYNVTAYISGHDHDLQHMKDGKNLHYFVIGSGSKLSNSEMNRKLCPKKIVKFVYHATGGYGLFTLGQNGQAIFTLRSSHGFDLYNVFLKPRF